MRTVGGFAIVVAALAGACARGGNLGVAGGATGTGGGATHHGAGGSKTTAVSGSSGSSSASSSGAGGGATTATSTTSSTTSTTTSTGGTCDSYCNGCKCPSAECSMCCANKNMVDECQGGLCFCY